MKPIDALRPGDKIYALCDGNTLLFNDPVTVHLPILDPEYVKIASVEVLKLTPDRICVSKERFPFKRMGLYKRGGTRVAEHWLLREDRQIQRLSDSHDAALIDADKRLWARINEAADAIVRLRRFITEAEAVCTDLARRRAAKP